MSNSTPTKKKEPGVVQLILVLAIISLVVALALGLINNLTAPAIAANEKATQDAAMQEVLPADNYEEVTYSGSDTTVLGVFEADDVGYVVKVGPSGFSGAVTMMVGVETDGTVSGVQIISHAETSGLGANATKPDFRAQFAGATEDVSVSKDGGSIQALTGATITSRAVCNGVNSARAAVAEMG